MSPNNKNQNHHQQPHRNAKSSVNTILGSSSHQRAKSSVSKSLTTSQIKKTTSLAKDQEIIFQTYGTSSNPASDEQQRSTKQDASTSVTNPIMITTARRTNHYAIAPYDNVKGNAPRSKIQNLTKIFAKFSTYTGAAVRIIKKLNKGKYMCIFFLDEKDLLDAIKVLITKSSKASPPVTENPNNNTAPEDHPDQPNPDLEMPPQFCFTKFSDAVPADDSSIKDDINQ
ncbi:hypothetical protein C1645_833279 [Glomus cerebriforme]|uniref:Uncharacterized protein n=1 Tax=Glomus cerebriforme TaxID=658196 RepID=A0A397SIG4_9GLOM|nr:hypothetical protein C1645_833279 [Glomus cerebriforme]